MALTKPKPKDINFTAAGNSLAYPDWITNNSYISGNVVKRNYTIWLCVINHTSSVFAIDWLTNGYWVNLNDAPGMVRKWAGSVIPPGYLLSNGASLNTVTYADLFAVIGYLYLIPTDICTGGSAISGGDYSTFTAARAFDNNLTTSWASSQSGAGISGVSYIGYDFGAGVTKHIRHIRFLTNEVIGNNVTSIKIQYSDNGSSWSDVNSSFAGSIPATGTTIVTNPKVWIRLNLDSSGAHRYWRILANANLATSILWWIYEIEMSELSATFNLPDYRGLFLRGAGIQGTVTGWQGTVSDHNAYLGLYDEDAFESHIHSAAIPPYGYQASGQRGTSDSDWKIQSGASASNTGVALTDGTNPTRSSSITKPANTGINYIIKY